jgi:hypothetical protein
MVQRISKKLSDNDVGSTGSHQAGILVPKDERILSFFPTLDRTIKNPRATVVVRERSSGTRWGFEFIYYNNYLFGGTRNEFRLTCMTHYLRAINARAEDELVFEKDEDGSIVIDLVRAGGHTAAATANGVLVLRGGWRRINY